MTMHKQKPISEGVRLALTPTPFPTPVVEPDDAQLRLIERITKLEQKFVSEPSGKRRYRLRIIIERLERRLSRDNLRRHNASLRDQLVQAQEELLEIQALALQLQEAMRRQA